MTVATAAVELDLDFVRARFPAFFEPTLDGWAFFENAGGSYPAAPVVRRLAEFYRRLKVQPYAPYAASLEAGAWMDESRTRLAAWLNLGEDEMHFGPSTSQNSYVLAQAFQQMLEPGDEIVVTEQDHEANSGVWRRLAEAGLTVREWRIDRETGHLDPAGLDRLLSERTRLVCFPHASNVVAEINPVAQIAAKAHAVGAVTVVDGVSYAPHGLPDVRALGADVYLFSSYKTYGPHQGVMTVRRELAERLPNQAHFFNAAVAKRLTPAGPDHAQIAALAGIAEYLDDLARHHGAGEAEKTRAVAELIRAQEVRLMQPLLEYLRGRNDVRLIGPTDPERRMPTIAVHHDSPGEDLARKLAEHRIMAGGGSFYANRTVEALGIDPGHGVLRLSFLHYTSPAEIDRLIEALDRVL